jgi:putative nucleotidyltransferase with HDIG domain
VLHEASTSITRPVLIVQSPRFSTPANDTATRGFDRIDISQLTADTVADAAAVVFNIELSDAAEREAVRTATTKLRKRPPLIFAVDRGNTFHFQSTQANALGARSLVKRPLDHASLVRALDALAVPHPPLVDALLKRAGGRSIAAAEQVIGTSFAALSSGAPLDLDPAIAAAQQLFAGVGEAGLHGWLDLVREHHAGTFQHCLLVTGAAVAYAAHSDLSAELRTNLTVAALLHDIGKAEIPNAILDKPGKLTDAEFDVIMRHPRIGADYLTRQSALPAAIIDPVLHHHEYLDGSGYPDGLEGDAITPMARVLTACDIYGALVEQRAYKPAKTQSEALYILLGMAQAGKVDPGVARTLARALGAKLEPAGDTGTAGRTSA